MSRLSAGVLDVLAFAPPGALASGERQVVPFHRSDLSDLAPLGRPTGPGLLPAKSLLVADKMLIGSSPTRPGYINYAFNCTPSTDGGGAEVQIVLSRNSDVDPFNVTVQAAGGGIVSGFCVQVAMNDPRPDSIVNEIKSCERHPAMVNDLFQLALDSVQAGGTPNSVTCRRMIMLDSTGSTLRTTYNFLKSCEEDVHLESQTVRDGKTALEGTFKGYLVIPVITHTPSGPQNEKAPFQGLVGIGQWKVVIDIVNGSGQKLGATWAYPPSDGKYSKEGVEEFISRTLAEFRPGKYGRQQA